MRIYRHGMHGSFLLAWLLSLLLLAGCDRAFYVFKDGKPMASIHVPEDASDDMKKAVDVFRDDVRRGYGVDIPLDNATNLPGRIELAVEERSLETEDDTLIDFPSGSVMRITGGESGVVRALFRLLEERAGVRYLYQGKYGSWFPPVQELAVPRETMKLGSCFPLTRCSPQTSYQTRKFWWGWEFRLGTKLRVQHQHDFPKVAFPLKAYRANGSKPDERIFPIQNGARFLPYEQNTEVYDNNRWQPCFSGQASADEAVKNILAYLKENPRAKSLSLAVNDGGGFCECAECLKFDQGGKHTNSTGHSNRSESYYRWLNRVVERVAAEYPDLAFGCLAYREVSDPPSFKLHPNIVPFICFDLMGCLDPEVMASRKKLIRDWSDKARLGLWAYECGDICFSLPRIYFNEQREMLRYLRDFGGVAAMAERSYFTVDEGPKMYLFFKLLENPDLDLEGTLNDWCAAAVGREAAPYLRQYYGFWEEFWRTQAVHTSWWQSRTATYLSLLHFGTYMYGLKPGDMAHCRRLMEKVLDLAGRHGTPDQKERAKLLMRCFEWYEAAAEACGAGIFSADGTLPDAASAVKLLKNIPRAQRGFEKWMTIPAKTVDWYAYKLIVDAGKDRNVVVSMLPAAADFLGDPAAQAELKNISESDECSLEIRFVAGVMLKGAAGDNAGNLADNGSFEKGGDNGWAVSHSIHGRVGGVDGIGASGKRSLKCEIQHGNFTATRVITNAKPNTGYYFAARIFIPTNQPPSLEGRLQFWGNPTRENGAINCAWPSSRPEMRLDPGKWNYVCAIVPGHPKADSIRLCVRLFNFESGAVAYIDDVQLFEMPREEAMKNSSAR